MKPKQYNLFIKLIHWLTVFTVIGLFSSGLWMVDLNYYSQWYQDAPFIHRSVGILLGILTLLRICVRLTTPSPKINASNYIKTAAHIGHGALYLALIIMFISGYLISTSDGRGIAVFDWFEVASLGELFRDQSDISGTVHFYTAWTVVIFSSLHALMALKHHYIDRDDTLRKMIGGRFE